VVRKCEKIDLAPFIREFNIKNVWQISLYVDEKNKLEIYELIEKNNNRFKRAVYVLLQGNYHNDLYGKEDVSGKTRNITAFKFKRRHNSNYRIYCHEYFDEFLPNVKKVVMIIVYNKKSQKIDKKLKSILEKISKYNYEI